MAISSIPIPAPLAAAGVTAARELDVRPVLAAGGDPFRLILATLAQIGPAEALHLVVGFEPTPLYAVLGAAGWARHTERDGDAFHVHFFRDGKAAPEAGAAVGSGRVALKAPVEMDVRGLEPPGPMLAILEKLTELGPGAQLRVRHHREPVLLYDKLALRGFAARAERQPAGDWIVRIAPAWAFENEKA